MLEFCLTIIFVWVLIEGVLFIRGARKGKCKFGKPRFHSGRRKR